MTKTKALEKILADLGLPKSCEDYVLQTIGMLGCDDNLDRDTIKSIELVIKQETKR